MIAIRGAIRLERNDRDVIYRETQRLLREIVRRNDLEQSAVVSAFFTMTPDLNADFPAYAAREMGWTEVPMLGAQETAVPGAMDRMVRVLVHADVPGPARHVYLGEAAAMRPDLAEEGDVAAAGGESRGSSAGRPRFGTLLVVGLGLVGGSLALAARRRGLFAEVLGFDLEASARELARRAGAVDEAVAEVDEGIRRADVVVLAIPVQALVAWLAEEGKRLRRDTVLVDVGSTKERIVDLMERLPEGVEAVGAHPMAGSEESGMAAARPDLFYGSRWALVETRRTGDRAREVVEALVEVVGGRALWTGAVDHDRATAASSHLPYLLSATLALHLRDRAAEEPVAELLGPGAKDMLRLAGSAPTVMAGILGTNWPHLREEVRAFGRRLSRTLEELERRAGAASAPGSGEGEAVGRLEESLAHVRAARASLLESAGGSAEGGRPELGGVAAGPADADRPDAGGPDTEGPGSGRSESRRPEDRGR